MAAQRARMVGVLRMRAELGAVHAAGILITDEMQMQDQVVCGEESNDGDLDDVSIVYW